MSFKIDYKSSMRGIRKCPQCGAFNGNRATKCKIQTCQQKLRDSVIPGVKESPSSLLSVVQLLQSDQTLGQLYSVCHRNGDRYFIASTNFSTITVLATNNSTVTEIERHAKDVSKAALIRCKTTAEDLPLIKVAIDSLAVSESEKLSLWEKSTHPSGPLVQSLPNDLFVVGHWQTTYGLCYVAAVKKNQKYAQLLCACHTMGQKKSPPDLCWHVLAVVAGMLSAPEKYGERWTSLLQQFIAQQSSADVLSFECLLADESIPISSQNMGMQSILNTTIMELFNEHDDIQYALGSSDFLKEDVPLEGSVYELAIDETDYPPTPCISDLFTTGDESLHFMDCQIELMDEFDPTDRIDFCPSDIECDESPIPSTSTSANNSEVSKANAGIQRKEKVVEITTKKTALKQCGRVGKEKLTRGSYSVRKLMKALESNGIIFNRIPRPSGTYAADAASGPNPILPGYEATLCNLSFTRWLDAVIEQLNSVIDYNTDGKPAVQTFRVHEDFFRCLRARFSVGHRLRQPDRTHSTDTVSVNDSNQPQVYRFTHHKSLLHVFRTDRMELSFEKSFIRTSDGRFAAIDTPEEEQDKSLEIPIRPYLYSTYIKLGRYKHQPDPDRVHSFTLEWIGRVLPRSGFGDLRISFEYGHRLNNQYVAPPVLAAQ